MSACPFCRKIAAGSDEHGPVTLEGRGVASFEPLNPVTRGHRLFVPTSHVERADQSPDLLSAAMHAAARYALWLRDLGAARDYNLIQSNGQAATQSVPHLHVHLVPRREGDGLALPWTEF